MEGWIGWAGWLPLQDGRQAQPATPRLQVASLEYQCRKQINSLSAAAAASPGVLQCFGSQNREAPLRLCSTPGNPAAANCELKTSDGTANPHLAAAALIGGCREGGWVHGGREPSELGVQGQAAISGGLCVVGCLPAFFACRPLNTCAVLLPHCTQQMTCVSFLLRPCSAVAGLLGVRQQLRLPPACGLDPGTLTEEQRSAAGIARLPASLGEAIAAFEVDDGELLVAGRDQTSVRVENI